MRLDHLLSKELFYHLLRFGPCHRLVVGLVGGDGWFVADECSARRPDIINRVETRRYSDGGWSLETMYESKKRLLVHCRVSGTLLFLVLRLMWPAGPFVGWVGSCGWCCCQNWIVDASIFIFCFVENVTVFAVVLSVLCVLFVRAHGGCLGILSR